MPTEVKLRAMIESGFVFPEDVKTVKKPKDIANPMDYFQHSSYIGFEEAKGDIEAKVGKALESGCNMVLICNDRPAAIEAINFLEKEKISQSQKVTRLKASESISWADLENDARRIDIIDKLNIIKNLKL